MYCKILSKNWIVICNVYFRGRFFIECRDKLKVLRFFLFYDVCNFYRNFFVIYYNIDFYCKIWYWMWILLEERK